MRSFKLPLIPVREKISRDISGPRIPPDVLGVWALSCGLLFLVTLGVVYLTGKLATPLVVALFILPLLALSLGLVAPQRRQSGKPARRSKQAIAGIWLGSIQLIWLGSLFLWPPVCTLPREPSARVRCASNLRQIGLAIQMYANDNKGKLPPDLETAMLTQDLTSEVFVCPSSNDQRAAGPTTQALVTDFRKPGRCSYILAAPLPMTLSALTDKHVLAYEPLSNHNNDGSNILFGDGHAEFLSRRAMEHLLAELKEGHNPPQEKP